jgi:alpha-galactosidase
MPAVYQKMSEAIRATGRPIVFSICQYGRADVWKWGAGAGGNLWRTTGDITDSWSGLASIGFSQAGHEQYAGPGHWNDPDMMLLGWIGWGAEQHPTTLTADEQYSHMSLWCLLSAPLLLGCDLTKLDEFTLNLLTNDEVIDVDQDPLGVQGEQIQLGPYSIALVKELEDGSKAVGFFNMGTITEKFEFNLSDIGIEGKQKIRDLWRQKDMGEFENVYTAEINPHGVVFVKMTPVKN